MIKIFLIESGPPCRKNNDERGILSFMIIRPLKVNLLSGGKCRLHLQGRRISQAKANVKIFSLDPNHRFAFTSYPK
jgi:hypothetical protein